MINDSSRGVIRNRAKRRRIFNMSGLRWDKITPTDIDAVLDFGNERFIIIEAKGEGVPVPYGQRLALERLLFRLDAPGGQAGTMRSKAAVVIVDTPDGGEDDDIDLGALPVREWWRCRWTAHNLPVVRRYTPRTPVNARQLIDHFLVTPLGAERI